MATRFYKVGSLATDTPTDIIVLRAAVQTTGRVSTFRLNTVAAGYAVTTGKRLYIHKIAIRTSGNTGVDAGVSLGYSDTDLGLDVTTARTNPVNVLGAPEETTNFLAGGITYNPGVTAGTAMFNESIDVFIPAAVAGKYMYCKVFLNAGTEVQLFCSEVTV